MKQPPQGPPPGWDPNNPMYVVVTQPPEPRPSFLGRLLAVIGSTFTPPKDTGRRRRR